MIIDDSPALDFCDVLLQPGISDLESRRSVHLTRTIHFRSGVHWTGTPLVVSNMDSVGTFEMMKTCIEFATICALHKHYPVEFYETNKQFLESHRDRYMVSTGIGEHDLLKLDKIVSIVNPMFICIDVANGYITQVLETAKIVRDKYPGTVLVCGNIVSAEIAEKLCSIAGVDVVKVGIGNGSVCTTRLQTGVGLPQLSAILEVAPAVHALGSYLLSDGGCNHPGDFSKAFCAGADFVMSGSSFAGTDESSGRILEKNGAKYKIYYGMSSDTAMNKYHGGVADYRSSEGKTVLVPYKGPAQAVFKNILGGIRSTCTYIGARIISDMPYKAVFRRVNRQNNTVFNQSEI